MALMDVNDTWDDGATGTFIYGNGETVGYTVGVVPGNPNGSSNVNGMHQATDINSWYTAYGGGTNYASVTLDEPVYEATFAITEVARLGQVVEFSVDGNVVNLKDLVMSGDVSISGHGSGSVLSLINDSGQLEYNNADEDAVVYVTFHYAVSSLQVEEVSRFPNGELNGSGVKAEFYLDTDFPPSYIPCFTAGTLIDTAKGPVPVEALKTGDMIRTKDHGLQPVKWVGGSRVKDRAVRIKAGTFGNGRDLVVSPRHRMLLQGWQMGLLFNHDEAFACAKDMQNGSTITMEPEGWVTYYHVLLDRHEVIFAEGAETESFFPDEASLNSMAKKTREKLAKTVDLSTYGRTVRPTLTANQAMYLSHNMDLLEDERDRIAAE